MPTHADGYLIAFSGAEVTAMNIRTFDVRGGGHPTETRRMDENTALRTFLVDWDQRHNFVEHVLGSSKTWDDAGTIKLSRLLPDPTVGRLPWAQQIMATRIEYIRGHGAGIDNGLTGVPDYPDAEIQVFFEHFRGVIKSDAAATNERDRYISRGQSSSEIETITLPGANFQYVESGGGGVTGIPVPFNVSWMRPVRRFTIWWHHIPNNLYVANGALFERLYVGTAGDGIPYLGCVNSASIEFIGLGTFAAGQLLLEGVEDRELTSPLAESGVSGLRHDIGFKFAFTSRGWLDLPLFDPATPANSGYYRVTNDGTYYAVSAMPDNTGLYNVRDMANLFDPDI